MPPSSAADGKRSRRRTWLARLALLSLLLVVPLLLLATPPGEGLVRLVAEGVGAAVLGGEVRLEAVEVRPWRGEVFARALQVEVERAGPRIRLDAGEVRVGLSPSLRFAVEMTDARLSVQHTLQRRQVVFDGVANLLDRLRVGSVELRRTDLTVAVESRGADVALALTGGDLVLRRRDGQFQGDLTLPAGWVEVEGRRVELDRSDAELSLAGRRIEIGRLALTSGASRVTASGAIADLTPLALHLTGPAVIAADLVQRFVPEADLAGTVRGEAELVVRGGRVELGAALEGSALRWGPAGPVQGAGRLELDRNPGEVILTLSELRLTGYGGRADLDASFALGGEGRQSLRLRAADVELDELFGDLELPRFDSLVDFEAALELEAWDPGRSRGRGSIRLLPQEGSRAALAGRVELIAGNEGLDVVTDSLRLWSAGLRAAVNVGAGRDLSGDARLRWADLGDVARLLELLGVRPLPVTVEGALEASGTLRGSLERPDLAVDVHPTTTARVAGRRLDVSARVDASRRTLQVHDLNVEDAGGRVTLRGEMPLQRSGRWDLSGEVESLDLRALTGELGLPLAVTANGRLEVRGEAANPTLRVSARLAPDPAGGEPDEDASVKTSGELELVLADGVLDLSRLELEVDEGSVEAQGRWHLADRILDADVELRAVPLRLFTSAVGRRLAGSLSLLTHLEGPLSRLDGGGHLLVQDAALEGVALPDLDLELRCDGGECAAAATTAGAPLLEARGRLVDPYPIRVELRLDSLPSLALAEALGAGLDVLDVRGEMLVELDARDPAALRYEVAVDDFDLAEERYVARATAFGLRGTGSAVEVRGLQLIGRRGALRVDGEIPLRRDGRFDLRLEGALGLELLQILVPDLEASGAVRMEMAVSGERDGLQLLGSLALEGGEGAWGRLEWSDADLRATATGDRVQLDSLRAELLGGRIVANGELPLPLAGAGVEARRLEFALFGVDVGRLLPAPDRHLVLSGAGRIRWPGSPDATVQGDGTVQIERAAIGASELGVAAAAPWRLEDRRLYVQELHLLGDGTDLLLAASLSYGEEEPPLEATLQGDLSLAAAREFLDPTFAVGGAAGVDARLRWSRESGLRLAGTGTLRDGRLALREPRVRITDIAGSVRVEDDTLHISELVGTVGDGGVRGGGRIELKNWRELGRVDLELVATEIDLELATDVRGRFSGTTRLRGDRESYVLAADLDLQRGLYARELDSRSAETEALSQLRWGLRDPAATLADDIALDVRLATEGPLQVRNEMAQFAARGSVQVGGALASPEIRGQLTAEEQGLLRFGRNLYDLRRAQVQLVGYPQELPELDIEAWTQVSGISVLMRVRGPADELVTELTSTSHPHLGQEDLASLLVTGRTLDAASNGVREIVGAQVASYLGDALASSSGVDLGLVFGTPATLPILAGETNPESRFTVGRQVSSNMSVAYSVGLENAESQLWILDYTPRRGVWLRAIQENGNIYTFEVAHRLQFETRRRESRGGTSRDVPAGSAGRLHVASVVVEAAAREGLPTELSPEPKLEPGDRYDGWRTRDEARRLQRRLAEAGYLGAVVGVETGTTDDGGVNVRFVVDPGPPIEVVWEGDDPGERLRRQLLDAWDGRVSEELLLDDLAGRLAFELMQRRYYLATVQVEATNVGATRQVVFRVALGSRGKRVAVVFEGNESLSDEELASALPSPETVAFFELLAGRRSRLEERLGRRYGELGILDVGVETPRRRFDATSGILDVTIPLQEGPVVEVEEEGFEGTVAFAESELAAATDLAIGRPFRLADYVSARKQLDDLYRGAGFWDTRVRSSIRRTGNAVRVVHRVVEGRRARAGRIEVRGLVATSERLVRRRMSFDEGDEVTEADLAESLERIHRLGLFRSVDIRAVVRAADAGVRDIVIDVVERPDVVVDYGLRFRDADAESLEPNVQGASTEGFEVALRAQYLQPFGRGGSLSASLFPQLERTLARVAYSRPLFFGRVLPTQVYLEVEEGRARPFRIDKRQWNLTLQQSRELPRGLRLQWGYQYGRGRLEAPEGRQLPDFPYGETLARGALTASLIGDRRNSVTQPTRGYFWNATLQLGSEILGSDVDFARFFGAFSSYLPLDGEERFVWASGLRLGGIASSQRFFLFFDDRFTAGGAHSVRGFEANRLGPIFTPTEDPLGGEAVVVLNQELRFPLRGSLRGGLFVDVGNVFLSASEIELGDLRETAGLGLRYELSFGVVRADYAFLLDRRDDEPTGRFHFSFGHAF